MFLNIWNFMRGYVTLEVSGFSVERFINLATHRGVYIWDVYPKGSSMCMKMSIDGYKKLKGATKKTKCKMKIVDKRGLPFFTYRYRKRKIFALGIMLFVIALYLLSSFIWVVEIRGNEKIKKEAILEFCEEQGLKPGAFKHTLDTKKITNNFMTEFENLSWLAIEIKGTNVKINIVETIKETPVIDKSTPTDVVARCDGLITDILVINGTPVVKVKDTVLKGDVLVSGMLTVMDGEEIKGYHYMHANAEVRARVFYDIDISEDTKFYQKKYSGETKKLFAVNILKNKFNILGAGIPYKNYDRITRSHALNLGGDFSLPVSIDITELKEYEPQLMERTEDRTKEILTAKMDSLLAEKLDSDDVAIIDKNVDFVKDGTKILLKGSITLEERIDEQREVTEPSLPEITTEEPQ